MNSKKRREAIIKVLNQEEKAIKGTELAKFFNVSRQVIVQDIALLRAEGENIIATPQGYLIMKDYNKKIKKTIVSKHTTYEAMREELQIMIDHGARVLDVIVEHPVYGEIKGILNIGYKKELEEFMEKVEKEKIEPLASLTEGVHIHSIEISDEESFQKMKRALLKKKYLIE